MNLKQLGLGIVLADFAALTGYAVYHHGYVGIFEAVMVDAATFQVLGDLTIALGLVSVWMWQDARSRGESALPWIVLTAFVGSLAPLVYLIRRESRVRAVAPPRVAQPARA